MHPNYDPVMLIMLPREVCREKCVSEDDPHSIRLTLLSYKWRTK